MDVTKQGNFTENKFVVPLLTSNETENFQTTNESNSMIIRPFENILKTYSQKNIRMKRR